MKNYNIEYSWNINRHTSVVVYSRISNAEELIVLCDQLYEQYTKLQDRLSLYFFNNRENASDYVYLRFVLTDFTVKAIENSQCIGYLEKNELYGLFSPPKLIKVYNTQSKIDDTQSNMAFL